MAQSVLSSGEYRANQTARRSIASWRGASPVAIVRKTVRWESEITECLGAQMQTPPNEITQLLRKWSEGDRAALDQLMPVVYQELRKLANSYLRDERSDHTLQPTALINEAYLRLVQQDFPEWQSRKHFYGVAAQLMRQILVEYARARLAAKRGAGARKLPFNEAINFEAINFSPEQAADLVALDDALMALAKFDERKARVIELRYFGGFSVEEVADMLGVSVATIGRETQMAQMWLRREMAK